MHFFRYEWRENSSFRAREKYEIMLKLSMSLYFFKSGKFQVLQNYSSKKQVALGFSKILIFCFTIAIWSVVQVWSISNVTRKNTQNYGHTGRKRHCDPILFLQFLNVLYMADICAKFKKYRWNILSKGITSRAGVINKYSSSPQGIPF